MAAVGVPCVTIFQEARDKIQSNINNVMQCLNNKKVEMFAEISRLEKEFQDKQQQKYKDLNKLSSIKTRTEEELGENSLREVQQKLICDLQKGIDNITLEIDNTKEPDYKIEVRWGMCLNCFNTNIDNSEIVVIEVAQEDTPVPPPARPPGENWKRRRNRRNRAKSVTRDENSVSARPFSSSIDTRDFGGRGTEGNDWDSHRGFSGRRGRGFTAVQTLPYDDGGNW